MKLRSNGRKKQREEQEANQDHGTNLSRPAEVDDDPDYINNLTESELTQGTISLLTNLAAKDFVLANLDDAEVHEHRWLTRIVRMEVESLHPHEDSMWQGRFRQVAAGEPDQALAALSEGEKTIIQQYIQGAIARVTRSKDGFQQEKMNESINVSERRDRSDDEGGFLGR